MRTVIDLRYDEIRAGRCDTASLVDSSALMRKVAFEEIGGYRPFLTPAEDFDLWLRIADRHALANLSETVIRYRMHPDQATVQHLELQTLCVVAARVAAGSRAARGVEPLDGVKRIDMQSLLALGATEEEITEGLIRTMTWLARTCTPTWAGYAATVRSCSPLGLQVGLRQARDRSWRMSRQNVRVLSGAPDRADWLITSARIRSRSRVGCQPIAARIFSVDGIAVEHVLDPVPVGLFEGDERRARTRARRSITFLREVDDRDLLARADVEDLAGRVGLHQPVEGANRVLTRGRSSASAVPSPKISSGSPASARSTKRGTTIPYWPDWRGPTVLKRRAMMQSRSRSCGGRGRGTRPSPSSRRTPSGVASSARIRGGPSPRAASRRGGRRRPRTWRRSARACRSGCSARARSPCLRGS